MGCLIVAEIGVCHNGSVETALQLVDAAKSAGADAVKFQLFNSRALWGDDRIAHLEISRPHMARIAQYTTQRGLEFMCTPFGVSEVEFLAPLVRRMKIASGCIGRRELLQAVAATKLPVILSTGMSTIEDIAIALADLQGREVTLLHCTSAYPCPLDQVNLLAMDALAVRFELDVGYSDHTDGNVVAIAAAAMGASVIEKHLTLDTNAEGPDHKASITPPAFAFMVAAIRAVETAMGDGKKVVQPGEESLRKAWNRAER